MKLDTRRLRYFLVVAEELNFSRAAERLHMAQPPLSYHIKMLEEALGVQLFERTRRGVRLTDAGQLLFDEARRILIQLEQTARMVERVGAGEVGRLSIGFVPSASNAVLPPLLHHFGKLFQGVEVFLQEMKPDDVVQRLLNTTVDVGFFYLPFEENALAFQVVSRETLVVALPEGHRLAAQETIDLQSLADEPFILPMRYTMPGLHMKVIETCRAAGFAPRAVQKDVWLIQTIVGLVAGGIGVALVPSSALSFPRHGVVYRQVFGTSVTAEMAAVWRQGNKSTVLRSFLKVVREMCPVGEV
ncbi:MAG: LysR family transcriptional regulator [Anaerolineae bacterium]|nr:LysR family transcriptional regulator [Anaerolineae bacterium]